MKTTVSPPGGPELRSADISTVRGSRSEQIRSILYVPPTESELTDAELDEVVTLEPDLPTPEVVHEEVETHEDLISRQLG